MNIGCIAGLLVILAGSALADTTAVYEARNGAHKRLSDLIAAGAPLPVNFQGRMIYYVGPVNAVRDEVVGPAGPTTASRMDEFTDAVLGGTGILAMIGKAERGPAAIEAIVKHRAPYLIAVGGAAYLISKAIKSAKVAAFEDLGMEAIHEFEVEDMPVTMAVDVTGQSVHQTGPERWRRPIRRARPAEV
jgi:fumarate hydratase class I